MRTRALIALSMMALAATASAQVVSAVTDDGDVVILNPDGTWRPADNEEVAFYYEATSAPLGLDVAYRLDDTLGWATTSSITDPDAELALQYGKTAVFAIVIYEETELPLDFVGDIVLANARNAGEPDVLRNEVTTVNGTDVLTVEFRTQIDGQLPFRFTTTAYSGPQGTIQLTTWTYDALFERNRDAMETLRDGLHILPPASPVAATSS